MNEIEVVSRYRDSFSYMASLKRGCTLESIVQPLIEVQKTSHSALYGCTPHSRGVSRMGETILFLDVH